MNEERRKVLYELIESSENDLNLQNKELRTIFEQEESEMYQESARELKDFLHDVIAKSLKGVNIEEYIKEDENAS